MPMPDDPPMPMADDPIFSVTASSGPAIDVVSGRAPEQPLSVPDEGVHVWELQGGQRISPLGIPLPEEHTIALWAKLLPSREREPGALIAGTDGTPWLLLGIDKLQGSPLPIDRATGWQLIVMRGSTTTETSTLCAWSGDPVPMIFGKPINLGSGAILNSVGDVEASLGSAESLTVWPRQLSGAELCDLWVRGCCRLGLPEPARWINLAAPPPTDTMRIVGRVIETVGGSPLGGVKIRASTAGPCAGQEASVGTPATSTAEDGTFIVEIPASSVTGDGDTTAIPAVVVTLAQDGFAPQTVVGAATGGEELRLPTTRLTRLSMQTTIDAAGGGVLTDASTSSVFTVPPSAFLDADGSVFEGNVTISTATIDPSDESSLASMPGDFSALSIDGHRGTLRSFGAYYFSAADANGTALDLNPAAPVSVEWPLSVPLDTCDKGVQPPCAWSFDAATGKWMQHGETTLEVDGVRLPAPGTAEFVALGKPLAPGTAVDATAGAARGKKWKGKGGPNSKSTAAIVDAVREILEGRATIKSLKNLHIGFNGWCNVDSMLNNPQELPCLLRGRLADWADSSEPWRSSQIDAVGASYASRARARVQSDGAFEIAVQPNSTVKLEVNVVVTDGDHQHSKLCELADVATGKALTAKDLGDIVLT